MLSHGNGEVQVCANNLLRIVRGEVPYDRLRGLDARNIDRPAGEAADAIAEDAKWCIDTYEPRTETQSVEFTQEDTTSSGNFGVTATIT